jgi:hypothetical protein
VISGLLQEACGHWYILYNVSPAYGHRAVFPGARTVYSRQCHAAKAFRIFHGSSPFDSLRHRERILRILRAPSLTVEHHRNTHSTTHYETYSGERFFVSSIYGRQ